MFIRLLGLVSLGVVVGCAGSAPEPPPLALDATADVSPGGEDSACGDLAPEVLFETRQEVASDIDGGDLGTAPRPETADGGDPSPWDRELTVMTFNLRTVTALDGDDAWEHRKDMVVDIIRATDPDVIGTQEGWGVQLQYIVQELPHFAWAGLSRFGGNLDEYCAVFWRTDRFALEDDGTFWLSPTPDVPQSVFSEEQSLPRIVTWVKLRPLGGDEPFFVFNTHFDTRTVDEIQLRSAELMARKSQEIAGAAVTFAIGDFNAAPDSAPWRIMTGLEEYDGTTGHFSDPWITLGLPEEGTFHGFRGVSTGARIDWLLYSPGAEPTEAWVDHYSEGDRFPSDHFPVTARYLLD